MSTPDRQYFSERQGRGPKAEPMPFEAIRRLVVSVFDDFRERDYLQEAFGYECVDAGRVDGTVGRDEAAYFLRTIRRPEVWPYWQMVPRSAPYGNIFPGDSELDAIWESWDEDTLFDMVEVLHDLVSKPVEGSYHSYNDCGWHGETFDRTTGQEEFRAAVNGVLRLNDPPYEIDGLGEIIERGPEEFSQLLAAPVPEETPHDLITSRIDAAVKEFRARGASLDSRRHAVRDLADVLEALRPDVKEHMLSADEQSLFKLANGFVIRHNNRAQQGDYDKLVWLRWAFYVYLATIHAVLRLRNSQQED
jgi:hypothetical protein